jgi:hypothetical protein
MSFLSAISRTLRELVNPPRPDRSSTSDDLVILYMATVRHSIEGNMDRIDLWKPRPQRPASRTPLSSRARMIRWTSATMLPSLQMAGVTKTGTLASPE